MARICCGLHLSLIIRAGTVKSQLQMFLAANFRFCQLWDVLRALPILPVLSISGTSYSHIDELDISIVCLRDTIGGEEASHVLTNVDEVTQLSIRHICSPSMYIEQQILLCAATCSCINFSFIFPYNIDDIVLFLSTQG